VPQRSPTIPYPAIEQHGVIGDRRTAALVAADGTINWLCLPDYDGPIVFGAVLDWLQGGHWKLGPAALISGVQHYLEHSTVLRTHWTLEAGTLLLTDAMLWPEDHRAPEHAAGRVLVRHLQCTQGRVSCLFDFQPRYMFAESGLSLSTDSRGIRVHLRELDLQLWSTAPLQVCASTVRNAFDLEAGQDVWAVLALRSYYPAWSVQRAQAAVQETMQYWRCWLSHLHDHGALQSRMQRAAMTIHLLTYSPGGCVVAAATTSLPERLGGTWNADYRLSWVRDTSLACAALTWLGDWHETEHYLRWLTTLPPRGATPFQVLYGIHGETAPVQHDMQAAFGYRGSRPVRLGNHAYKQVQMGSLGFLADCALIYLQAGGTWRPEYGDIIRAIAEYTVDHWQQADNGIWELQTRQHYVSSKVMSWVALDRAIHITQRTAPALPTRHWEQARAAIHEEVMQRGWSERLGAFRQRYEGDNLDAAALLIPVMDFLSAEHPRVLATLERVATHLTIDGLVFRFDPRDTPGVSRLPMGQMEGAFLPCTFWLATAYAKASQPARALAILERVESLAGALGLFAEGIDPRTRSFAGNTPLLFSHIEYVRARLSLARLLNHGD
jgi:GH15 family glucan-1,4-alpha-glucosidase